MNAKTKSFVISLSTGAVIAALSCVLSHISKENAVRVLCDAFFVAAIFLLGSAGLSFVRNEGLFDIFGFGVRSVFGIHWPWMPPNESKKESYVDYKERKKSQRRSPLGMLLAGGVYILLSLIFLIIL